MAKARRSPSDIVQLKVRMREHLRKQLEHEAEQKRISLNAAIVDRLELSFLVQHLGQDEYASANVQRAVQMLGRMFSWLETLTGKQIFGRDGDSFLHSQVEKIVCEWVKATRPQQGSGESQQSPGPSEESEDFVASMVRAVMKHERENKEGDK